MKWSEVLGFELDDTPDVTEDEIDDRVVDAAGAEPGGSWSVIAALVKGCSATEKIEARKRLLKNRRLVNLGTEKAMRLYRAEDVDDEQTTLDDEPDPREEDL